MAYIGKDPAQIKRALNEKDTFTGDGSTVAFDLTSDASGANEIQVFVDNIRQEPGASDAYTLGEDGSGNLRRITFTAAPDNGAEIYVLNPKTTDSNLIVPSDNSVTSAKIVDGAIVNADINACAAISDTKLATISTSGKVATSAISQPGSPGVYLDGTGSWSAIDTSQQETNAFNISLLGFKMAVNEGLTVFNLVDGVVDEFNDESGTDEAEGSNDNYCASSDFYANQSPVTGATPAISAGFTTTSVTEPDTSTAGTNPAQGQGTYGTFTVPCGATSINVYAWGSGGATAYYPPATAEFFGGGGGFASGTLAVTSGQSFNVVVGEGGLTVSTDGPYSITPGTASGGFGGATDPGQPSGIGSGGRNVFDEAQGAASGSGGGLSGLFNSCLSVTPTGSFCGVTAPQAYIVAGAGGGAGYTSTQPAFVGGSGGDGGGTTGNRGYNGPGPAPQNTTSAQTAASNGAGGGGDQEQGGQASTGSGSPGISDGARPGGLFYGGESADHDYSGAGGSGYYGGGGGAYYDVTYGHGGGGGSSYIGQPQITCGSTEGGGLNNGSGGGTASPFYVPGTNNASEITTCTVGIGGQDGYLLLSAAAVCASTTSTTIVSEPFTSTSVPTTARIVVFEQNVDTPTLNTDIVASISRDGGTTFTNATLSDSGYVTGSSGQRILTGQATISGQPSGQSMRWKLALANNRVKIHGVSLQWA